MERIEARALKSSFLSETAMITTQQVCFDDARGMVNVTCDDFSVDDLLDFSDKDFEDGSVQESEEEEAKDSSSASSHQQRSFDYSNSDNSSGGGGGSNDDEAVFGPLPAGELAVPVDELENLEWLSQIVDDSGTEVSLLCPVGTFSFHEHRREPVTRPAVHFIREPSFPLPVSKKPRGKRSRPNGRTGWTLWSPSETPESSLTSSSFDNSSRTPLFVLADPVRQADWFLNVDKSPPKKQQKKNPAGESGSASGGSHSLRRCSHCHVQKTPQWRAGPLGPKTLCNACGVRYKSGRLYPEYRPACSPTFSQEIHSNSHRKVLEMRRKKETTGVHESGLSPMIQGF